MGCYFQRSQRVVNSFSLQREVPFAPNIPASSLIARENVRYFSLHLVREHRRKLVNHADPKRHSQNSQERTQIQPIFHVHSFFATRRVTAVQCRPPVVDSVCSQQEIPSGAPNIPASAAISCAGIKL